MPLDRSPETYALRLRVTVLESRAEAGTISAEEQAELKNVRARVDAIDENERLQLKAFFDVHTAPREPSKPELAYGARTKADAAPRVHRREHPHAGGVLVGAVFEYPSGACEVAVQAIDQDGIEITLGGGPTCVVRSLAAARQLADEQVANLAETFHHECSAACTPWTEGGAGRD